MIIIQFGKTALMRATERGHVEIVQLLIGAGADTTAQDRVVSIR